MATNFYYAPSKNGIQKTLSSILLNTATAGDPISLSDVDGIQNKPGVLVINRVDSNGVATPSSREYITFTGTSGSTVIVETRNADSSSSAKTHAVGSIVEFIPDAVWAQRLIDQFIVEHSIAGAHTVSALVSAVAPSTSGNLLTSNGSSWVSQAPGAIVGDLQLQANANIQVDGADPYKTIVLPAASMSPTTTAGCATVTTVEAGTNDVDYKVLDFDQTTEENAFVSFAMPDSWDGGTILASFIWTTAASSGDVIWAIKGRAFANDDAIDQAYGTAQTVTDSFIAAGDIHISAATSAMTFAGSPAGGQWVQLKIYRDADAGGDTLNGDARLIAVSIKYKLAKYSD